METKEFTNDFSQGMTNIPSDSVCQDDSVAAEWNMIFRNGEHQPIQAPINLDIFKTDSFYILNIHEVKEGKHYIGIYKYKDNDNDVYKYKLVYCTEKGNIIPIDNNTDYGNDTQVTSIGNTLIVNIKGKAIRYFLWKTFEEAESFSYKYIGDRLPSASINFRFKELLTAVSAISSQKIENLFKVSQTTVSWETDKEDDVEAFFAGLYAENKKKVSEAKGFCNPFLIRYAIKLFDGQYTNISSPILMFPCVRMNTYGRLKTNDANMFEMHTMVRQLEYWSKKDLREWNDIIKSIGIFITNPVDVIDNGLPTSQQYNKIAYDMVTWKDVYVGSTITKSGMFYESVDLTGGNRDYVSKFLKPKLESDIINELVNSSVFYKIGEISLAPSNSYEKARYIIKGHDLENLTTLEQLDHDDYFSNCSITGDNIYMYNKRLHISNVSRGFYEGADVHTPFYAEREPKEFTSVVYIKTNSGIKKVKKHYETHDVFGIYYFYPDPRAYRVDFFQDDETTKKLWKTLDLKPHPLLNGAYYISDTLPNEKTSDEKASTSTRDIPTESIEPESLENEIWVSEVNNPFIFTSNGVYTVGEGRVIGIISNTNTLSQGQFGRFPLFCFTTDGIWTLEVSSTGEYSTAHPMSRDICNNVKSITSTDHLIFFPSEKGLMMINGSQVTCVSSMLSGKTFYPTPQENEVMVKYNLGLVPSLIDFLKEAMIAYDYRDNLLWILNPNHKLVYILSIDSGAFAMTTIPDCPVNVINDYPDTIIETKNGETFKILSLINRPNINDDERRIDGFIFSRPMKFDNPVGLKNLSELRLIERLNEKAGYRLRVFVSDDLKNWTRTNSLRGRGFKYYKLNLIFENMLPTDTVSAIIGRVQTRYQIKFR